MANLYTQNDHRSPSWILSNGHSAIRSADAENPSIEPNMEWIGCTVCEIFAFRFKLYRNLETKVRGNSRSSIATLFNRAHTNLYSSSTVGLNMSIYYRFQDIGLAAYWLKIATPVVFGDPVRSETVRFTNSPWWRKLESWAYQIVKEFRWLLCNVQPFWYNTRV